MRKEEGAIRPVGDSEVALVRAARRGRADAIARIYERYWKVVHAALLARVPSQEAEDLTQDVFAAAMRRISSLRSGEALGGWLLAIARNRAASYWRSSKKTTELSEELGRERRPVAEVNQVLAKIQSLPEAYRETLIMRFVEGMTGPDIAEATGLTHGSVRVNLSRGMSLLREILGEEKA